MCLAWQAAIKEGTPWDYYLLLNDDTNICNNVFDELFEADDYGFQRMGCHGLSSGVTCQPGNKNEITYGAFNFLSRAKVKAALVNPTGKPQSVDLLHANILLVHHSVTDSIGIFYKGYRHGGADFDYTLKASRKGFPGYLYSEFANIYERAGIVKNKKGSLTQIPILTMPGDDITHPIPDLTGYITEGQIILDRTLYQKNIYPPISVLPSLSRLMKDSIGENKTLKYHSEISSQLLASYAKVSDARNLSSVIGADELSDTDKKYLIFGEKFENEFINQDFDENRTMEDTLKLGLNILTTLPSSEITRVNNDVFLHYNITKND